MKNEIKPDMAQEKLKFVALYWGQEFVYGNNVDEPYGNMFHVLNHLYNAPSAGYKALLTPLSQITDEDAIEVARKLCFYYEHDVLFTLERTTDYVCVVSNTFGNIYIWYDNEITSESQDLNVLTFLDAYDHLRSRGYALPFMGRSVEEMVELGWIKLKGDSNHG